MKTYLQFLKDHITLFLATISGYLYLCTYIYEYNFLKEFSVSADLIRVDLNTILTDTATLLITFGLSALFYHGAKHLCKDWLNKSSVHQYLGTLVIVFCILVGLSATILPFPSIMTKWILAGVILFTIVVNVYLKFIFKTTTRVASGLRSESSISSELDSRAIATGHSQSDDEHVIKIGLKEALFILIGVPAFVASMLGQGEAAKKITFDVFSMSNTRFAVIRTYGDWIVCKPINDNDKSLSRNASLIKIGLGTPVIFTKHDFNHFDNKFELDSIVQPDKKSSPRFKTIDTISSRRQL